MKSVKKWGLVFLLLLSLSACKDKVDSNETVTETNPINLETEPEIEFEPGMLDVNPLDLIETAEDNLENLDTYSVVSNMAVEFGDFTPDDGYDQSCIVDQDNVTVYCQGRFDLVRIDDTFWRSEENAPWREPVESKLRRVDVVVSSFEHFGISAGLVRFAPQGFPTVEISDWVNDAELVQETLYEGFSVYEISFTVDDSYHDALNYGGGLATSTMGAMRETATTLDGSGTGTVYIDKELLLIRHLAIDSTAQVDDFEAATALRITFSNFNEPVTIPDPLSE